jgi:putative SOS response-associated peptidase YedK
VNVVGDQLPPSYNVAPTQPVRVVLARAPRDAPETTPVRQLRTARWGLVPSWSRDPKIGSRLINARMETITEKPSFKAAAARRRACTQWR